MSASPSSRIYQLPDTLVSQIKAGEVIERPASALKELLENALDSGARSVKARVDGGGLSLIAVEDDGEGIEPEDLPLAFARHATSKIRSFEDLSTALTMGFRGEALASLGSVARVEIISRREGAEFAQRVCCEEGVLSEVSPAARARGTSVEARDLFFYVPARRKFLKSATTEFNHCKDAFLRAALSRPDVAMTLSRDGKIIHKLPSQTLQERAKSLLGDAFAQGMTEVRSSAPPYALAGFASPVAHLPSGRESQYLFVNHRHTRDRLLSHAAKEALLQTRGPGGGKEVSFVLFLTLPPQLVDANAHPAKTEVRFRDPRAVHQFTLQSLVQAFKALPAPEPIEPEPALEPSRAARASADDSERLDLFSEPSGRAPLPASAGPRSGPRYLGRLRNGWCAWDCEDGLWVARPTALAAAPLALELSALALDGAAVGDEMLIAPRVEISPARSASLKRYARQLDSLGVSLSFEPGFVTALSAPAALCEADWHAGLPRLADLLASGRADALGICFSLFEEGPESPAPDPTDQALLDAAREWEASGRLPRELPGAALAEFPSRSIGV